MGNAEVIQVSLEGATRGLKECGCADELIEGLFVSLSETMARFHENVARVMHTYTDVAALCRMSVVCGATIELGDERELLGTGLFGVDPAAAAGMLLDKAREVEGMA